MPVGQGEPEANIMGEVVEEGTAGMGTFSGIEEQVVTAETVVMVATGVAEEGAAGTVVPELSWVTVGKGGTEATAVMAATEDVKSIREPIRALGGRKDTPLVVTCM